MERPTSKIFRPAEISSPTAEIGLGQLQIPEHSRPAAGRTDACNKASYSTLSRASDGTMNYIEEISTALSKGALANSCKMINTFENDHRYTTHEGLRTVSEEEELAVLQGAQRGPRRQKLEEGNWLDVKTSTGRAVLHEGPHEARAADSRWCMPSTTSSNQKQPANHQHNQKKTSGRCIFGLASTEQHHQLGCEDFQGLFENHTTSPAEKVSSQLTLCEPDAASLRSFSNLGDVEVDRLKLKSRQVLGDSYWIGDEELLDVYEELQTRAPAQTGENYLQHGNAQRVSRPSGGKDRHSKVYTSKGLRDRRVRLSPSCAIQLFDIQDRIGVDQPSKAVDWLLEKAKAAIEELPHLDNSSTNSAYSPAPAPHIKSPPSVESLAVRSSTFLANTPITTASGRLDSAKAFGALNPRLCGGLSLRLSSITETEDAPLEDEDQAHRKMQESESVACSRVLDLPRTKSQTSDQGSQGGRTSSSSKSRQESRAKARERARERAKERSNPCQEAANVDTLYKASFAQFSFLQ